MNLTLTGLELGVMAQDKTAYLVGVVFGGLVAGALCGLLPFFLAKNRNRMPLGVAAITTCAVCGLILGLLLALPVALVFTVIIVAIGPVTTAHGFSPIYPPQPPPPQQYGFPPAADPGQQPAGTTSGGPPADDFPVAPR
ncbi:MAG TPA: hypothetical protein VG269_09395 [Tepidisphaeraceae bacterium]|nr:hypothetical protein [Tepidisphaeraceae bacterium]